VPGVRPRILLTTDAVGGVWQYSLDLASGFAARGLEPVLALMGPGPAPPAPFQVIETGLPLDWTAENAGELRLATDRLRALAEGMASVHLHAPALVGDGQWPAPVVAVAHSCVATWWQAVRGGKLPADFAWRAKLAASGLHAADAVIAPTAAHADAVRNAYGSLSIEVIHNGRRPTPVTPGLDPGVQATEDRRCRSMEPRAKPQGDCIWIRTPLPLAGEGAEEPAIRMAKSRGVLTAGRLWDEGKNIAALDHAAATLPIRAAGPVHGPNGAQIAPQHLALLGNLDAAGMARAYAEASVFVSLARYEPFGLAVLEAAQAGLRLVLSDIPSFRELWDGVALFVHDEQELVPTLRRALADGGDGGARERAQRYTVDRMVEGTLAVHRAAGAAI